MPSRRLGRRGRCDAAGAGRAGAGGSASCVKRGDGIVVVLMVRVPTAPMCGLDRPMVRPNRGARVPHVMTARFRRRCPLGCCPSVTASESERPCIGQRARMFRRHTGRPAGDRR